MSKFENDAEQFLANYANGDARAALNLLENAVRLYSEKRIGVEHLRETLQSKHLRYDKTGEEHYNTISAFIKSMRASDADAALYYMARMVDSGEDPKFIARRMVIFASEDIGNRRFVRTRSRQRCFSSSRDDWLSRMPVQPGARCGLSRLRAQKSRRRQGLFRIA